MWRCGGEVYGRKSIGGSSSSSSSDEAIDVAVEEAMHDELLYRFSTWRGIQLLRIPGSNFKVLVLRRSLLRAAYSHSPIGKQWDGTFESHILVLSCWTTILSAMLERINLGRNGSGGKSGGRHRWVSIDPDTTLSNAMRRVPTIKALLRFLEWTDHERAPSANDNSRSELRGPTAALALQLAHWEPSVPPDDLIEAMLDLVWKPSRKNHSAASSSSSRSPSSSSSPAPPRGWAVLTASQIAFVERVEKRRRADGSWSALEDMSQDLLVKFSDKQRTHHIPLSVLRRDDHDSAVDDDDFDVVIAGSTRAPLLQRRVTTTTTQIKNYRGVRAHKHAQHTHHSHAKQSIVWPLRFDSRGRRIIDSSQEDRNSGAASSEKNRSEASVVEKRFGCSPPLWAALNSNFPR